LSLCTGLMFMIMGAVHLAGQGSELRGVQFADALSMAYTVVLGPWMYHVFMLTAFFAMFSTSYTVMDGFARSFAECCGVLRSPDAINSSRGRLYFGFVIVSALLAIVTLTYIGNPVALVTGAALVSLAAAPFLYGCNLYCVTFQIEAKEMRPATLTRGIACCGILVMVVALAMAVYVKLLMN
jgi:hypothetical protein